VPLTSATRTPTAPNAEPTRHASGQDPNATLTLALLTMMTPNAKLIQLVNGADQNAKSNALNEQAQLTAVLIQNVCGKTTSVLSTHAKL